MPSAPPKDQVPVSAIAPLIRRWVEKQSALKGVSGEKEGHLAILGFQARVAPRTLRCVMNENYSSSRSGDIAETINFDLADKIVCATEGPMAWLTEPELAKHYGPLDVTYKELRLGYELPEGYEFETRQRRYMWTNARQRMEVAA